MLAGFRSLVGRDEGDVRNQSSTSTAGPTTLSIGKRSHSQEKLHAQLTRDADEMLSRELKTMSFQERLQIQEEIHGVANLCPPENPEMIQDALKSMQQQLDGIQDKPIYDKLSESSYVHTKEFRLRFLRCELFDSKKAAERLVRFTQYYHDEFDMEVLERPLTLSDLETKTGKKGKEVMKTLKTGYSQILPFRDRSGRMVFFANQKACNVTDFKVCWLAGCSMLLDFCLFITFLLLVSSQ